MTTMAPLVEVTLRGLLGRRRTLLLVLLVGLPVLIALLVRLSGGRPDADRVLDTLVVRTVMPLVALIVGTAAIGSEIDDGTAVYLMIKPIPRWRIAVSKILVAAGLTSILVVPAVVITGCAAGQPHRYGDDDRRLRHRLPGRGQRLRRRVRGVERVHVPGPPPGPRLRADLGGRPVRPARGDEVPVDPPGDAGPRGRLRHRHAGRSADAGRVRDACSWSSWSAPRSSPAGSWPGSRSAAGTDPGGCV